MYVMYVRIRYTLPFKFSRSCANFQQNFPPAPATILRIFGLNFPYFSKKHSKHNSGYREIFVIRGSCVVLRVVFAMEEIAVEVTHCKSYITLSRYHRNLIRKTK